VKNRRHRLSIRHFARISHRLWPLLLGSALSFWSVSARADLWAYVDAQGHTHFAAEQVDERYKLFFKGADFERLQRITPDARRVIQTAAAARPSAAAARPADNPPKRLADIDSSPGYLAARKFLKDAAKQHAVDYELLKAVAAAESGFDSAAVSPKGAVGLMQLMPATAERYGVKADKNQTAEQKLADPKTNIQAGTRHLKRLLDLFAGQIDLALAAYNAGEGAVQRAGNQVPNYKETQGYVKTVMQLYALFKPAAPVAGASVATVGARVRMTMAVTPAPLPAPARNPELVLAQAGAE